jgi:hypothetical protein
LKILSVVKRLVVFNGKIYGSTEHTGDGSTEHTGDGSTEHTGDGECLFEWNESDAWVLKASCFSSQTFRQALYGLE